MKNSTKIARKYTNINFQFTKGQIDIFLNKQFHPHYEIYILLGGKAEFVNDHNRIYIYPNNLLIIPPGEYHRLIVEDQYVNDYERCVLNIYPDFLKDDILEKTLKGKEFLKLEPDNRIVENFRYLRDSMMKSTEDDFRYILNGVALDIIFLVKQYADSAKVHTQGFIHPVCSQIMSYINSNYKSKITIDDIAQYVFLSPSSVSHKFKIDFDMSIKKYITEKRMNEIRICLQNGQKPQEVSNDFGFSNYSTFYRCYYKHFGIPPSQTKKVNRLL